MKKRVARLTALSLCTACLIGIVGNEVYASGADASGRDRKTENTASVAAVEEGKVFKDETVYILAGADGSVQKIIVSDWLRNAVGADVIEDVTGLSNVENVKGNERYTPGDDKACVWDAQGNDIYYQGNIEQELPVDLTVTYTLDGQTVSPEALAGQSGHVTIRFDYTNKQYDYAEINGESAKIYVPFAMLTGLLLDNGRFSNVEVSNGKLVNDGDRTVVVGVAFPGLEENLALDSEKLEIPDYLEISADVTDFELGMTVTVASSEPFGEMDPDGLDPVEDLRESLKELTDAMEQLMDGSSQLDTGLRTLLDQSGKLVDGINALAEGSGQLKSGAATLDEGASALQSGAERLYSGLATLNSNSGTLNAGAGQVFESLLSTANAQLSAAGLSVPAMTISNYAEVLNGAIASLDETAVYEQALATVTAAVEAQRANIEQQVTAAIHEEVTNQVAAAVETEVRAQVTEAVRAQVLAQVIYSATNMSPADYEAAVAAGSVNAEIQAAIEAAAGEQMQGDTVLQTIESKTAEQMASGEVQGTIAANVEAQMSGDNIRALVAENTQRQVESAIAGNMAGDAVQSQLAAASEGARKIIALKASLDSYQSFYIGLQNYTAGVAQAAAGSKELKDGTDSLKAGSGQLYGGISQLSDGIGTMKNGAPALIDGIAKLQDGAMQLSDGLREFDEKGVEKLVEAVDGDLNSLMERIRATGDLSKSYRTFSGITDEMDGQVKFIYRTEPIETAE